MFSVKVYMQIRTILFSCLYRRFLSKFRTQAQSHNKAKYSLLFSKHKTRLTFTVKVHIQDQSIVYCLCLFRRYLSQVSIKARPHNKTKYSLLSKHVARLTLTVKVYIRVQPLLFYANISISYHNLALTMARVIYS